MKSIFFDLETTDLNYVGQILNYSFIEVDEKWNIVSRLNGKVRLSRLQIPSPRAILTNKVDIIEHQKDLNSLSEPLAMQRIRLYIDRVISSTNKPVKLIGYNSQKFDVPFLRTSMIRNGYNPYFGQSLKYADLLHVAQNLAVKSDKFNEVLGKNVPLRLQNLYKAFIDSSATQSHESEDDVLWTIEVAKHFAQNYNIDVRTYKSYEPPNYDNYGGKVLTKIYPSWDSRHHKEEFESGDQEIQMVLLQESKTQALWIDLEKYKQGLRKEAVFWFNKNTSAFFVKEENDDPENWLTGVEARANLKDITLDNFFPPKNCDIEQFIYMMGFDENEALSEAIHYGNVKGLFNLNSKYGSELYLRYLAANKPIEEVEKFFKNYVMYRYGGELKLSKNDFETKFQPGILSDLFHKTFNEIMDEIEFLSFSDNADTSSEDQKLLESLKEYILESDIYRLCGPALELIERFAPEEINV